MGFLVAGIVAWSLVHLAPAILPGYRERVVRRLGKGPYSGLFSLCIIGSAILIVVGWKSAPSTLLYPPLLLPGPLPALLNLVAFLLYFASQMPGNVKRYVRHPQMTGTILWAAAHLLTNGEIRSVLLFGGLGTWAAVEIFAINRRDGAFMRPDPAAPKRDVFSLLLGALAFAAVFYFHGSLFGVSVMPR